ncbi:hypothetical protein H4S01_001763 [Coemansia sp. RSA 2610]|nr:hypothetical protein H4S01_001763 [Coemansia sp. RSA 2610]
MLKKIVSFATAAVAMASTASAGLFEARAASASDVVIAIAQPMNANITAMIRFVQAIDGDGLELAVSASGLDKGAEYPYHIHVNNVPSNGNCTATGGHLNPYEIASSVKCDPSDASKTCELGDLAGVFGNMVGDDNGMYVGTFNATQLTFGGKDTVLDHSIVIHNSKGDRIACANIIGYILGSEPVSAAGIHDMSSMDDMEGMEGMDSGTDTSGASSRTVTISGAVLALFAAALF